MLVKSCLPGIITCVLELIKGLSIAGVEKNSRLPGVIQCLQGVTQRASADFGSLSAYACIPEGR